MSKNFSLYTLTGLYQQLLMDGVDMDPQVFADTLAAIEDSLEQKVENYAKLVRHFDAEATMIKNEIDRLAARKKSLDNRVSQLKENMQLSMELTNTPKIKSSLFTIWIQDNQPGVEITNEKQLLKQYKKIKIEFDKAQLLKDLKAGKTIRGAALGQPSRSIRIK